MQDLSRPFPHGDNSNYVYANALDRLCTKSKETPSDKLVDGLFEENIALKDACNLLVKHIKSTGKSDTEVLKTAQKLLDRY